MINKQIIVLSFLWMHSSSGPSANEVNEYITTSPKPCVQKA